MKYFVQTNDDCEEDPDENVLGRDAVSGKIRRAGHGGPTDGFGLMNSREEAFGIIQEYARILSGREHMLIIPHELETMKLRNAVCEAKTDHFIADVEGHWCFIWFDAEEEKFKDRFFFVYED